MRPVCSVIPHCALFFVDLTVRIACSDVDLNWSTKVDNRNCCTFLNFKRPLMGKIVLIELDITSLSIKTVNFVFVPQSTDKIQPNEFSTSNRFKSVQSHLFCAPADPTTLCLLCSIFFVQHLLPSPSPSPYRRIVSTSRRRRSTTICELPSLTHSMLSLTVAFFFPLRASPPQHIEK